MSDTSHSIENLILGDVADDYEEFEHILRNVKTWAAQREIPVNRKEVLDSLGELVRRGLVLAYRYSSEQQRFIPMEEYCEEQLVDLWFYITPKGLLIFEPFGEE